MLQILHFLSLSLSLYWLGCENVYGETENEDWIKYPSPLSISSGIHTFKDWVEKIKQLKILTQKVNLGFFPTDV